MRISFLKSEKKVDDQTRQRPKMFVIVWIQISTQLYLDLWDRLILNFTLNASSGYKQRRTLTDHETGCFYVLFGNVPWYVSVHVFWIHRFYVDNGTYSPVEHQTALLFPWTVFFKTTPCPREKYMLKLVLPYFISSSWKSVLNSYWIGVKVRDLLFTSLPYCNTFISDLMIHLYIK